MPEQAAVPAYNQQTAANMQQLHNNMATLQNQMAVLASRQPAPAPMMPQMPTICQCTANLPASQRTSQSIKLPVMDTSPVIRIVIPMPAEGTISSSLSSRILSKGLETGATVGPMAMVEISQRITVATTAPSLSKAISGTLPGKIRWEVAKRECTRTCYPSRLENQQCKQTRSNNQYQQYQQPSSRRTCTQIEQHCT